MAVAAGARRLSLILNLSYREYCTEITEFINTAVAITIPS